MSANACFRQLAHTLSGHTEHRVEVVGEMQAHNPADELVVLYCDAEGTHDRRVSCQNQVASGYSAFHASY